MKAIENIHNHIQQIPPGKPFNTASLRKFASDDNVRQILSRLVKSGEITRAARGIFVRPQEIPYLGKVLPESRIIAELIAEKSGETIAVHGAEAARILQLSTQVPMQPIFCTTGNTRHIKMGKLEIILKHISPRKLVKPGTLVGLVISALWYLGKNHVSTVTIEKIKQQIEPEQFNELIEHLCQMPAWMANIFYSHQKERSLAK